MSLILCHECGKDISAKAEFCPHCGYPYPPAPSSSKDAAPTPKAAQPQPVEKSFVVPPVSGKKEHSTLSKLACIFSGCAFIFPMFMALGFLLSLAGLILGIVDVCLREKGKRHLGSYFAFFVFCAYLFLIFAQIRG